MSDADIVVVGGGIAGTSTAYHLAQHGHQVTLLERGEIASEASGVNAGSIGALGWGRLPDLQAYLTMGSLALFQTLQLDQGYDLEFRQSGALQAIHHAAQYTFSQAQVQQWQAQGYTAQLLSTREARNLEPEINAALLGCVYMPLRGQADPVKATRAFAAAAQQHGARVLTQQAVTALQEHADGSYLVTATHGTFHAGTLVLAAGAWCAPLGAMLGLHIPVVPVRGQMWATAPLPPRVLHVISSAESSLYWDTHRAAVPQTPPELTHSGTTRLTRHLYGRQTRTGEIIFGGDRQLVGTDRTPDPAGVAVNHGHAAEVLPLLRELPMTRTWAGLMPFTLDGEPLIGKLPHYANLYIVGGLASSGFGRGPMAGKLLADFIHTRHPHPVLAEADPARCVTQQKTPR